MSEVIRPASGQGATGHAGATVLRALLYAGLGAIVVIAGVAVYRLKQDRADAARAQDQLVALHHLRLPANNRLAPEYTDKDGNLAADAPADDAKLLDPETLVLAHYIDADTETQAVNWEALEAQLAQATGKKIVRQEYRNGADEVAAVQAGQIQVVALHAADTPYLVNHAGFVPVAVLGSESGAHGNRLDIAVAPDSKVQKLADIRGRTLVCTAPDSITGYRAAIVVLLQDAGLRPHADYSVTFSHGQKRSILGLKDGKSEVAALSDDKLQSLVKSGAIAADDYRVIYSSQVIPRLTIGYVHNLRPELAVKLTAAVLSFDNAGGAIEPPAIAPLRFLLVDYKKDFEFVRRIDDSFDPRFAKQDKAPAASEEGSRASKE